MNRFEGHIGEIRTHEQLSQVSVVLSDGLTIQAMVIETPETASYLDKGGKVSVLFKETEVILCLSGTKGISEPNQIKGNVFAIESGTLLSWVSLKTEIGNIGAVIPSESVVKLGLQKGQAAIACVKTTEVMLSGI